MRALLAESLSLEVAVPEEEPIASRAKAIEWWLKRASNAFLKRGTEIGKDTRFGKDNQIGKERLCEG